MPSYKRYRVAGGTVFLTMVTYGRRPLFGETLGQVCLREAILHAWHRQPFDLFAICLLPDHLHTIWQLPPGDHDYSDRVREIKREFTLRYLAAGGVEAKVTAAEAKEGRRGVWQPRFWEHTVQDDNDLKRCGDYLHWNPRKHGLVRRVVDHAHSSFHRFVALGEYDADWGGVDPDAGHSPRDWGE